MKADVKKAQKAAEDTLSRCRITAPPVPVEEIARQHKIEVRFEDLEEATLGMIVRAHEVRAGDLHERVTIAINTNQPPTLQRLTLAHELGHFILHLSPTAYLRPSPQDHFIDTGPLGGAPEQALPAEEQEANAFALALLMPKEFLELDRDLDPFDDARMRRLSKRYQVSVQSMVIRLLNLNLIPRFG